MATRAKTTVENTAADVTAAVKTVKTRAKATATKTTARAKKAVAAKPTLKQVATKSTRKVSSVVHMTRDASFRLIDAQRSIWLAGLGALAKVTTTTGERGEKAFEALGAALQDVVHLQQPGHFADALLQRRAGHAVQLTEVLQQDVHLKDYFRIPSKDNGFDIEGILQLAGLFTKIRRSLTRL